MRTRLRYVAGLAALLLLAGGIFLAFYVRSLAPRLKQRVISALEDRFDADVQLSDLRLSWFPFPRVDGDGLVIKHRQWNTDAHPLIKIASFRAVTGYTTLLDWRNRVDRVTLEGLEIHVPARGRSALQSRMEANPKVASSEPGHDSTRLKFLIETIVADHSLVEIEPKKAGNDPLQFPIEKLTMHSVGPGDAMTFTARLTNAKPPGAIETSGHFGPWQRDDPRATPLSGDYTFQNADLSVFKGIRGTLSSHGRYGGILQQIKINGETDTPRFALEEGGSAIHLTTRFHAVVDGTNGDTILDPVDAKFGQSEFLCSGGIVHHSGEQGKTVELDARTKYGRMEDILNLLVSGPPVITGEMEFRSKIVIPPSQETVADKLKLDGQFHLTSAVFKNRSAEKRLSTLSNRARGISKSDEENGRGDEEQVASDVFARFKLDNSEVSFSNLAFELPGAQVELAGEYNLRSTKVNMNGKFQMRATLSETQSGMKRVLLRPLDGFFKKNGLGFEIPVSIGGTREHLIVGASAFHKRFNIH